MKLTIAILCLLLCAAIGFPSNSIEALDGTDWTALTYPEKTVFIGAYILAAYVTLDYLDYTGYSIASEDTLTIYPFAGVTIEQLVEKVNRYYERNPLSDYLFIAVLSAPPPRKRGPQI